MRGLLVLLRHGQTPWNAQRRFQGHEDIALDDVGRAQAEAAAQVLARRSVSLIVSSDLSRAADTAAPLAARLGLQVRIDPRLREINLGSWQGLDDAEAAERHPEEHRRWRLGEDVRRGGGETYAEVAVRGVAAVQEAMDSAPGEAVAVVTHGGTARAIIASLLELPLGQWPVIGPLANCCWSTMVHLDGVHDHGRWRLLQHNTSAEPGGPIR